MEGLRDGTIDAIATDHAPHTATDKCCTMQEAAFGISGLETAFGLVYSLVDRGDLDLPTLIERLTPGLPACLAQTPPRVRPARACRGSARSRLGPRGDVTLLDPDAEWPVDTTAFASKGRNTPLDGITLKGKVVKTFVGGKLVYDATGAAEARA